MTIKRPEGGWKFTNKPPTPGEMLYEEFLKPLKLSQHALAMKLGVPATRIADIVHGRRTISPDTAIRLGRFFKTSPEYWLNMQQITDIWEAQQGLGADIETLVPECDYAAAGRSSPASADAASSAT